MAKHSSNTKKYNLTHVSKKNIKKINTAKKLHENINKELESSNYSSYNKYDIWTEILKKNIISHCLKNLSEKEKKKYNEFYHAKIRNTTRFTYPETIIAREKLMKKRYLISNKEIVDKALLWGALWIYLADKKFSKEEQEKFSKRFGDKATVSIKSLLNISKISVIEKKVSEAYASASTLLKSEKEKIITKIKEIYSEADEHNDKSKEIFDKLIKLLK